MLIKYLLALLAVTVALVPSQHPVFCHRENVSIRQIVRQLFIYPLICCKKLIHKSKKTDLILLTGTKPLLMQGTSA